MLLDVESSKVKIKSKIFNLLIKHFIKLIDFYNESLTKRKFCKMINHFA